MANYSVAQAGEPIILNLQKMAASSARFSTAMALYGLDRVKSAAAIRSGKDFHDFINEMNATVSTCSVTLEHEIGDRKKEMLQAVTKAGEDAIDLTIKGLRYADPSRIAELLAGMESPTAHDAPEPVLAAEALAS